MYLFCGSNLFSSETLSLQYQGLETQSKLVLSFLLNKKDTVVQNALESVQQDVFVAVPRV